MNKLNKFMDCLDEPDFKEAAKAEAEIIEEECKNGGICRNFLTCKVINNPNTKDMIEKKREIKFTTKVGYGESRFYSD